MTRTTVLAGNWKMNLGPTEALEYFAALARDLGHAPGSKAPAGQKRVIFPPAYALGREVQSAAAKACVELGAQNVHWEDKGAFTGELSASALKSVGLEWALVGHSERRQYFGETDETAANRFRKAALIGLNVVFCIGERLPERESGQTEAVLTRQLGPFLAVLKELPPKPLIWCLAYEPVWAIGTGKTATNDQAQAAHAHIRKVITEKLGEGLAQKTSILYGGSVTPENAKGLLAETDVDGVLVGGASLKPESFAKIIASA
jgi:triosephosphate isomerase